jgi:hypothetical protein
MLFSGFSNGVCNRANSSPRDQDCWHEMVPAAGFSARVLISEGIISMRTVSLKGLRSAIHVVDAFLVQRMTFNCYQVRTVILSSATVVL